MITTERLNGKCGIYCAIHRDTKRCYVGSSINMGKRRGSHVSLAKKEPLTAFHRAICEFGEDAFDFEVLEFCEQSKLLERERFWIVFYHSASANGFNTNANPTAIYDRTISNATRERWRAAFKGKPLSEAHKKAVSEGMKGRKFSDEQRRNMGIAISAAYARRKALGIPRISEATRKKLSAVKVGKKYSPEHCAAISLSQIGKKISEGTKSKLRAANLGKKHTPEAIAKMRLAQVGKTMSAEAREKISKGLTGRKRTPEQIAKQSVALKANWAERKRFQNEKALAQAK